MSVNFNFFPDHKISTTKTLNQFKKIVQNPSTQFFYTFNRSELVESTQKAFSKFKTRKTFVHVGIGGSSLGPEMLIQALKKTDTKFIFINNIDPEEISEQLNSIEIAHSVFYFVSKSGGTAETMAALSIITNFLYQKGISETDLKNYYVFATDPKKSELLDLGKKYNIELLEVPSDVGGRFCALTPVGFFPALFAGIDLDLLISGAKKMQELLLVDNQDNPLLRASDFFIDLYNKRKVDQTVFMPYSSKLKYLSFWFTQLWAESLGKKFKKDGSIIHTGLTPITAYGATDQHSQVQLFMEGPNNKALIIIEVLNFNKDFELKSNLSSLNLDKLRPYSLSDLMKAELHGTLKALKENDRPYLHISISKINEETLAGLILYFESLTALVGDILEIDPFNQPGVEAGKIYAFEFLSLVDNNRKGN
jgi:glucose-6-phosphate isomerase